MLEEGVREENMTVLHHLERPNTVPAANQPKIYHSSQTASPRMH